MNRLSGRAMAAAVVLGVSAAVVLFIGGVANAAPPAGTLGTLTLAPPTGSDLTVPTVTTSAGCPSSATLYNVIINGPGGFNNYAIVGSTGVGLSHNGPFSTEFNLFMRDAAGPQGVVPGEYDVTLQCVDDLAVQIFGTFTTAMYFDSPTHYTTTPPLTPIPTSNPTPLPTPIPSPTAPPAGTLGTLTLIPATGTDLSLITVTTSAGCPNDPNDDSYNVIINGPGGLNNYPIVGTTSVGISHEGPFSVGFSTSMKDAAGRQGVVPGEYFATLQCINNFTGQLFGTFTTAMVFDSPTTYQVFTPTTTPTPSPGATPTRTPAPSATLNPKSTTTTTTLRVFPDRAFQGFPVILLTNVAPRGVAGIVQLMDGTTPLGAPVPVAAGFALTITTLPKDTHSLTVVFSPANPAAYAQSTSSPVPLTVSPLLGRVTLR